MKLGSILANASKKHRILTETLIDASERTLFVDIPTQPQEEVSGASLFADLAEAPLPPQRHGPYRCLWYDATAVLTKGNYQPFALTGTYPEMKALAIVKLRDALIDPADSYGETLFDRAKQVSASGHLYKVIGTERDGLATTTPYILMVVLAGEVQNADT